MVVLATLRFLIFIAIFIIIIEAIVLVLVVITVSLIFIAVTLVIFDAEDLRLLIRFKVILLFILALCVLILNLIQSIHELDLSEISLYCGCFPVNLVEREALIGVDLGRYGCS